MSERDVLAWVPMSQLAGCAFPRSERAFPRSELAGCAFPRSELAGCAFPRSERAFPRSELAGFARPTWVAAVMWCGVAGRRRREADRRC
eukprot:3497625-Rhodomonas_salina.2